MRVGMPSNSLLIASDPDRLSHELRTSDDPIMRARRDVVALSLVSATCMGVIALYQIGRLKHLPEPPLPLLDADTVDASAEAYTTLSTGDAFLGFVSYGVTMLLAAIGSPRRHQEHPFLPMVLAGKAVFDAGQAAKLTVDQWTKHRAFCSWCLVAAASTFAVLPRVLPESRASLGTLKQLARSLTAGPPHPHRHDHASPESQDVRVLRPHETAGGRHPVSPS
jgi:hypothetical protein